MAYHRDPSQPRNPRAHAPSNDGGQYRRPPNPKVGSRPPSGPPPAQRRSPSQSDPWDRRWQRDDEFDESYPRGGDRYEESYPGDDSRMYPGYTDYSEYRPAYDDRYDEDSRYLPRRRRPLWDDDENFLSRSMHAVSVYIGKLPGASRFTESVRKVVKKNKTWWSKLDKRTRVILLSVLMFGCVLPSLLTGVIGLIQGVQISSVALGGYHELQAAQQVIKDATHNAPAGANASAKAEAIFTPQVLQAIHDHCANAERDFIQLEQMVGQRQGILGLVGVGPVNRILNSVDQLAYVGIDAARMGEMFSQDGSSLAPIFSGDLLNATGGPIFTSATFDSVQTLINQIQPLVDDMAQHFAQVNVGGLPLSSSQKAQMNQLAPVVPLLSRAIDLEVANSDAFRWLVGIDSPRLFLIQTMDRGEIRATGGFTGQFGALEINGGRVGKIKLIDVNQLDDSYYNYYNHTCDSNTIGSPPPYQSWWPFCGFGLRDSNLSPNFPTSAKYAMQYFTNESGFTVSKKLGLITDPTLKTIDGVINFSPLVIEHLLNPNILGSLHIDCYNETITEQNLEDRIHYYQDGPGQYAQSTCASDKSNSERKQFTSALSSALQDQIRKASSDKQSKAVASILNDWKNKAIQAYFTDPRAEGMLTSYNLDGTVVRTPTGSNLDTSMIVHSNIGANKGFIYVNSAATEDITLNSDGSAKHHLTLVMSYDPKGDVFPYSNGGLSLGVTMRDFIRLYVTQGSKLTGGSGFDQANLSTRGEPYCDSYLNCRFPSDIPKCQVTTDNPQGIFIPGDFFLPSAYREGSVNYAVDYFGPPPMVPPLYKSDEKDLGMFGGLAVIPKNCTATLTVDWTVAGVASGPTYTFLEQSQSDAFTNLTVNITNAQGAKTTYQVNPLVTDQKWTVNTGN